MRRPSPPRAPGSRAGSGKLASAPVGAITARATKAASTACDTAAAQRMNGWSGRMVPGQQHSGPAQGQHGRRAPAARRRPVASAHASPRPSRKASVPPSSPAPSKAQAGGSNRPTGAASAPPSTARREAGTRIPAASSSAKYSGLANSSAASSAGSSNGISACPAAVASPAKLQDASANPRNHGNRAAGARPGKPASPRPRA